jgi:hypothetical protein
MWPTFSSADDQQKQRTANTPPHPSETKPADIDSSIKETANTISDNLMEHVDRALNGASHATTAALPSSR